MSRQNSRIAAGTIQSAVRASWEATISSTFKIEAENADQKKLPASGKSFARMHVRPASKNPKSLGESGASLRGQGVVIVQVFIHKNTGTFDAHDAADALDSLSNTEHSPIAHGASTNTTLRVHFRSVQEAMKAGSEDTHEQWNIEIPYFWDSDDAKGFVNIMP